MTQEELNNYLNRITELKDLFIISVRNKDYVTMQKYAKEITQIKKILSKANKEAKKNERISS